MRSTPFGQGDDPDEWSWELYHENAKRGRRTGVRGAGADNADSLGDSSLPGAVSTPVQHPPDTVTIDLTSSVAPAGPPRAGALALAALTRVLEAADQVGPDFKLLNIILYFTAVDALPAGLYHVSPAPRGLVHLGQAHRTRDMMAALSGESPAAATIFVVGALEKAAQIAGERGLRRALIATGRAIQAFETAAGTAGIACRDVTGFYDREVDSLLRLDGLSRSVLGILALDRLQGPAT